MPRDHISKKTDFRHMHTKDILQFRPRKKFNRWKNNYKKSRNKPRIISIKDINSHLSDVEGHLKDVSEHTLGNYQIEKKKLVASYESFLMSVES